MIDFSDGLFPGEMLPYERKRLYTWVRSIAPEIVFETGTGSGGGSTRFIAEALKETGGQLHTCDPGRGPSTALLQSYPNIHYYPVASTDLMRWAVFEEIVPQFVFFDGPEDPDIALEDIKIVERIVRPGAMFAMHDWETTPRLYDGLVSTKAAKIRPYMETSMRWQAVEVLSGLAKNADEYPGPDSVGLCLYRFIG